MSSRRSGRLKYNTSKNKPYCDGYFFDSKAEMRRYIQLKMMQQQGLISDLSLQPVYKISKGGVRDPATGRMMSARKYKPDFRYIEEGKVIIEDVKSKITSKEKTYRLKRQLFCEQYVGFTFRETY